MASVAALAAVIAILPLFATVSAGASAPGGPRVGAAARPAVHGACHATAPGSARSGRFLGLLRPIDTTGGNVTCAAAPSRAYSGSPPLVFNGGPVMGTTAAPGAVTVTAVYWDPSGTLSASYKSVTAGFLTNVAADSGKLTNVFSDDLQYGIKYQMQAGTPVVDADAFPANGCTPDTGAIYSDNSGYGHCLTDAQVETETAHVLSAHGLPGNLSHAYLVFLPKGVESCFTGQDGAQGGACTINPFNLRNGFCAYHSSFGSASSPTVYADVPFPIYNSPTGLSCASRLESPNSEQDADLTVDAVSHELNESITDPTGGGWWDGSGNEIADDCNFIYGGHFGGNPGALFSQTINGAHYFIQEEFSNEDFRVKRADSCIQRVDLPTAVFGVSPKSPRAGVSVSFAATKSKGQIKTYSWNFGDGSPSGSGVSVSHTYGAPGSDTVTLTVTDDDGVQATTSTVLTVR